MMNIYFSLFWRLRSPRSRWGISDVWLGPLPSLWIVIFLQYAHDGRERRGREKKGRQEEEDMFSLKGTNVIMRVPPYNLMISLRPSNMWTMSFLMFKLVLEKAEEAEIKLPASSGSSKNRVPEKHLFVLYWLCQSLWLCGSQSTVENPERDGNTRPPDLPPEKSVCRSGSNS